MLLAAFLLCTAILFALLLVSCARQGITRTILSHFWYFSLFWYVGFPLRAVLIDNDSIDLQVERSWTTEELLLSVLVSFGFWLVVYFGHASIRTTKPMEPRNGSSRIRAQIAVLVMVGLALWFVRGSVLSGDSYKPFIGNEQNEARVGAGHVFAQAELFVGGALAYMGIVLARRSSRFLRFPELVLFLVLLAISVVVTVALNSRRIVAAVLFSLAITLLLKKGRDRWLIASVVLLGSVLLAPLFQVLRYLNVPSLLEEGYVDPTELLAWVDAHFFLTILSSSFEGVDHLAVFLEKATLLQLGLGIDFGASWIYNGFLSLVPRVMWVEKPLIYGSVAQQFFLYPEMYTSGAATVTLPASFVVDFMFGFGIVGGLILSFVLGRILEVLARELWLAHNTPASYAISLFAFVQMFNIFRGGTGVVQQFLTFLLTMGVVLGFRASWVSTARIARKVLLPSATLSQADPTTRSADFLR